MTHEAGPIYPTGYPANDVYGILRRLDEISETLDDDVFALAEYAVLSNLLTDEAAAILERISHHDILWQGLIKREYAADGGTLHEVHTLRQLGDFEIRVFNDPGLLPDRVLVVGEPVIEIVVPS